MLRKFFGILFTVSGVCICLISIDYWQSPSESLTIFSDFAAIVCSGLPFVISGYYILAGETADEIAKDILFLFRI